MISISKYRCRYLISSWGEKYTSHTPNEHSKSKYPKAHKLPILSKQGIKDLVNQVYSKTKEICISSPKSTSPKSFPKKKNNSEKNCKTNRDNSPSYNLIAYMLLRVLRSKDCCLAISSSIDLAVHGLSSLCFGMVIILMPQEYV